MRLNKFLAEAGLGARRKVEELIKDARVKVNGVTITNLATTVDPKKDIIKVDNKVISIEDKIYILLNKPTGYLTTVFDERGRKTILDLVKVKKRVFPVGRLDLNSHGLLLLTNDGDFAAKILHPKHKIAKTYFVKVSGFLSEKQLNKFRKGIIIDGKKTALAKIKPICHQPSYKVILTEGRKRQIRRMFKALGFEVLDLKRVKIANLAIGKLKSGQWRYLSKEELKLIVQ